MKLEKRKLKLFPVKHAEKLLGELHWLCRISFLSTWVLPIIFISVLALVHEFCPSFSYLFWLFLVTDDLKGECYWNHSTPILSCTTCTDYSCDANHGHMAVFCAPLHAPEQISVPPCPLSASQIGCPLRYWSPLQPPFRRSFAWHFWWGDLIPNLGHDCANGCYILLLCCDQDCWRPLWALASRQHLPYFLSKQHCLPWYPPSASRDEI